MAYVYARLSSSPNYTGAQLDLILGFRGIALGFRVIPVGIGVGLFAAAMKHIVNSRLARSSANFLSGSDEAQCPSGSSSVSRRRRGPAAALTEEPQHGYEPKGETR